MTLFPLTSRTRRLGSILRFARHGGLLLLLSGIGLLGCKRSNDHDGGHDEAASDDHGHNHGEGNHDAHGEAAHEDAHDGGHGHEHAEDAIGITRWTEKLELFAEHPPAVTGKELTFLAHLTILDGFKALEDATVTLVLDGPGHHEAQVTKMLRPGIFQPALTAPAPGTYRAKLTVKGPEVEDVIEGFEIVVSSTSEAAQASENKNAEGEDSPTGPEPISFLKEQQWQVPFGTAFARQGSVVPTTEVSGEVTTPPSGQADVSAAISGRIVAPAKGLPRPGQAVRKGELLALIAPAPAAPEDAARAELAVVEAEARLSAAKASAERAERLIKDRAIPQKQVDDAKRELAVSEQAVKAAKRAQAVFSGAQSGSGGGTYRVTAPIDGVVVDVEATAGKAVRGGDPILRVVDLSELWITAKVPEQQAALISKDQDGAFQLQGLTEWFPLRVSGESPSAHVVTIGRTVDRRSRTVEVIYALSEPDERLRIGALLRVAVPTGKSWLGVVVPREAVLEDDGRSIVYVQVEGEAFEERAVELGPRAGAEVGVRKGVEAGERVVTRGANVIRLSARAGKSAGHGHVH